MLQVADADPARLQAAADDAATLALSPLSRRLPHLNVLANVATLLGLLGTISGLITAFSAVGAADPAQRSAFMAAGISTALNATAFGLIIAIPTLLIQGFLVGMVEGVAEQVDEMSHPAHAGARNARQQPGRLARDGDAGPEGRRQPCPSVGADGARAERSDVDDAPLPATAVGPTAASTAISS